MFDAPANQVTQLIVAFDEGRPLRRRQLFPPYQTGRESDPNFMEFEKYVLEAISQFSDLASAMPVEILRGTNTEADDLIATAVLNSERDRVRICSTDRDFLQLVDERVSIYSPVKRLVITTENFAEATAPKSSDGTPSPFPRERYLQYRVASGDASDNLPGIPGVGTLTAAKLLNAAPLHEYLDQPAKLTKVLGRRNARMEAAFASGEAAEVIDRNAQLMDLRAAAENYPDLAPYRTTGKWDEAIFRAWVKEQRVSAIEVESAVACMTRIAERA
jgi:5'-3' exonuclease